MAYSNWRGLKQDNYVVNCKTGEIIAVTTWTGEGVKIIDSFPIPERYNYRNCSRYMLAKWGWYPNTKAGNEALAIVVNKLQTKE